MPVAEKARQRSGRSLRRLSILRRCVGIAIGDLGTFKETPIISDSQRRQVTGGHDVALFVLPIGAGRQTGPIAAWATTSGWALGAEQLLGSAWIVSDAGVFSPGDAASKVTGSTSSPDPNARRWRQHLPEPAVTLFKDLHQVRVGRQMSLGAGGGPWTGQDVAFVWQRHVLFRRDGRELSRALDAPLVLSVHAMQVEEAASWGVRRQGWARYAERWGELPQLRYADLVACVSDGVAQSVTERGVPESRVIVTPNGVDLEHFRPRPDRASVRRQLGIAERFVVGWSGSFRRFHGLELALEMMSRLQESDPNILLLLMGDGQQRATLERRVRELDLRNVVFTGSVPHERMPSYLSACDAGLVLSPATGSFHYSPVKLREYMACGLPVIAHGVGELSQTLHHGTDALLVPPGEIEALADAVRLLNSNRRFAEELGIAGMAVATRRWSWSAQVERVRLALEDPRTSL